MSYSKENIEKFISNNINTICDIVNNINYDKKCNTIMDVMSLEEITNVKIRDVLSSDKGLISFIFPDQRILCVLKSDEIQYWNSKRDTFSHYGSTKYVNFSTNLDTFFDYDFVKKLSSEWKNKSLFIIIPTDKKFVYHGNAYKKGDKIHMILPYDLVECQKDMYKEEKLPDGRIKYTKAENGVIVELYTKQNGNRISLNSYRKNKLHGLQNLYHDNNVLAETIRYNDGNIVYHAYYNDKGYLSLLITYEPNDIIDVKNYYLNSRNCIREHIKYQDNEEIYYKKYRDTFFCSQIV